MDTAFRAEFGSGPLVIGICAEYDALPGLGHACGHNIIAASAVGAALALAEVADELGLTVVLLGTPAEEAGGGKVLLLNAGTFDDIAATVMVHPGPIDIARARSLALSQVEVTYHGREAHAAVAPYLGVNAADAITVAQMAIGLLRQQFAPGQMAHGIVTDGGQAPNVIPARTVLLYMMRGNRRRIAASPRGQDGRLLSRPGGRHGLRLRDRADRAAVRRAGAGQVAGRRFPRRDDPPRPRTIGQEFEAAVPLGSTDMGNVTQVMPGIHPVVGVDAGGVGASARLRDRGGRSQRRQGRPRWRDHAGPHGGRAGRDAHRARPGARAAAKRGAS